MSSESVDPRIFVNGVHVRRDGKIIETLYFAWTVEGFAAMREVVARLEAAGLDAGNYGSERVWTRIDEVDQIVDGVLHPRPPVHASPGSE